MTSSVRRRIIKPMRPDLPSGTVTLLFTDVEGSTLLLSELGADAYAMALAEHRQILRVAFTRHAGVEVDTQGDAFFVAFPTAAGALAAAAAAQERLASGPMRVRMGIHTGAPELSEEGYIGADVHRAARIAAAGHGGQVLVSMATAALTGSDGLRDLGEHWLKDLSAAERIWQLGNGAFPPLKSLHQTNLPIPATPLIGRLRELEEIHELLRQNRLVTLTGPGGSGKTRLAMQTAAQMLEDFADGVWWVALAAQRDPGLVESTLAGTIGARGDLTEYLARRRMLLVLDNFEQVMGAAPRLAELLQAAPDLTLLVTSRERLGLRAEQTYHISGLPGEDAIALFGARARQVRPEFQPDAAVAAICRRLDGLPLAVELAAARINVLTPDALVAQPDRALDMLTGGHRDAPERQRSLRSTIAWSYELLSEEERLLFTRLGIFHGGFDLDAAERAADADVDTLASLIDKSLLQQTAGGRFVMLATIHEFASERLETAREGSSYRRRHAVHFAELGESAEAGLEGPQQDSWLTRLDADRDNLRSALEFWRDAGDAEAHLQLAVGIWRFWWLRNYLGDARASLEDALAVTSGDGPTRRKAVMAAQHIAYVQGDSTRARQLAIEWFESASRSGDLEGMGGSKHALANLAIEELDFDRATELDRESLRLCGTKPFARYPLHGLTYLALIGGQPDAAHELGVQCLAVCDRVGDVDLAPATRALLGMADVERGKVDDARRLVLETVPLALRVGSIGTLANRVAPLLAAILAELNDAEHAVRLLAAAEAALGETGQSFGPLGQRWKDRIELTASQTRSEDAIEAAQQQGRTMPLQLALDDALRSVAWS